MIGWCTGSRCGCGAGNTGNAGWSADDDGRLSTDRHGRLTEWVYYIVVFIIGKEGGGVGDGKAVQKCGTRNCVKSDFRE